MKNMKELFENKNVAVAFASGLLFVGVVAAYYYGYNEYQNSAHQSYITQGWNIILMVTAVALSALFALGIPYLYSKDAGCRKFVKVVFLEAILMAVALVISGFFFFPSTDNCNNSPNSDYCPGSGGVYNQSAN